MVHSGKAFLLLYFHEDKHFPFRTERYTREGKKKKKDIEMERDRRHLSHVDTSNIAQ